MSPANPTAFVNAYVDIAENKGLATLTEDNPTFFQYQPSVQIALTLKVGWMHIYYYLGQDYMLDTSHRYIHTR